MARHACINRFVNPDSARGLSHVVIAEFLGQFEEFSRSNHLLDANSAPDIKALHRVLASRPDSAPLELVEAMVMLDVFGEARHHDALRDELVRLDIEPPAEASPADLALTLYMHDPSVLERLYAEQLPIARRRFESHYSMASTPTRLPRLIADADVQTLQSELERDFKSRHRGASVRVYPTYQSPWHRLVVRRGDVLHRESTVDGHSGETRQVTFCPERFDVILLHETSGEILVNARTRADTTAYLTHVGGVLLQDPAVFRAEGVPVRFSYDHVWSDAPPSLAIGDTPELTGAVLTSIEWSQGRSRHIDGRLRSDDLLEDAHLGRITLPACARITGLTFQLSFVGGHISTVRLRSPNTIVLGHEGDIEIIMRWLALRGFARTREEATRGLTGSVLAHARVRSRRREQP